MTYKFTSATEEHVEAVMRDIVPDVKAELEALRPGDVGQALKNLVERSEEAWAASSEEGVICIFGVYRMGLLDDKVSPWLITTNLVQKHKKDFLKGAKISIAHWLDKYEQLENYIPAGFDRLLKWLAWAGFTIDPPSPYKGRLLHRISMGK